MRCTRRSALGALASAVLAACGGGGGDGAGGDGGGDPAGSGGGGGGNTPPAQSFRAFGPSVVASRAMASHAPAAARLAGGGNVVLWMRGDGVVRARFTDAAGQLTGDESSAIPAASEGSGRLQAGGFSVAAAPDGGFVVAWANESTSPSQQDLMAVQARRYSADGDVLWETQVSEGPFAALGQPVLEPWNGGFIVGWTGQASATAPQGAYLRGLGPDGGLPGRQVQLAAAAGDEQEQVRVAPLADGGLVAVWRERTFDGGTTRFPLYARRFAFDLAPATMPVALPGFSFASPYPVDAETLPDGNIAIAWAATGENSRPFVNVGVFTPALAATSSLRTEVLELAPADIRVLPLGPGFGVAWQIVHQDSRETTSRLSLWRFDAAGEPTGAPVVIEDRLTAWVSPTTGVTVVAGPGFDMKGGADGHWVAAFHRANATQADTYLMGR